MVERAETAKQIKPGFKYDFFQLGYYVLGNPSGHKTFRNGELVLVSRLNLSGNSVNLYG